MTSLCLFLLVWSDSQPSSINSLSMLHNFVAPVTIRAASVQRLRVFFIQKSNCPKQYRYIPKEDVYKQNIFFSKDFLETLNLRAFNKFSLDQDFSDIYLTCSSQLPVFEKVRPRCLLNEVFFIIVPFIKRGGWSTGLRLREINIDSVFRGLNVTSQAAAQSEIVCKSVFPIFRW